MRSTQTTPTIRRRPNRRVQRSGHPGRAAWRAAAATDEQIEALRAIAMSNGHTFKLNVNRGDAWKRIKQATVTLDEQLRRRCAPPWYTRAERPRSAAPGWRDGGSVTPLAGADHRRRGRSRDRRAEVSWVRPGTHPEVVNGCFPHEHARQRGAT